MITSIPDKVIIPDKATNKKFPIYVNTSTGLNFTLLVEPSDTIVDIKSKIEEVRGFRQILYSLFFAGRKLEDGRTLSDYNITEDSALYLKMEKE